MVGLPWPFRGWVFDYPDFKRLVKVRSKARKPPPVPLPPGPRTPPDYLGGDTCAECWEPFGDWFLDRFFHRRRWGHNPVALHPTPSRSEQHQQNVDAARRYRDR